MTKTAQIYGSSLYDLALEEGLSGEIFEQMVGVRDLFQENPDYMKVLREPSIPLAERCRLIDEAFASSTERYLVNFIKLLCERGLLGEYGMCCEEYTGRYYKDQGIVTAIVTSAIDLTEEQTKQLQERLEKSSGRSVRLKIKVDPSVVAGLRVEMDGVEMDGTVKGRLDTLSKKLKEITV